MSSETTTPNPMVTIVTPCYNAAEFIARTIQSVQDQEMVGWEHIIVDDGSTDGSGKIVEAIASVDCRVKLVTQPNAGVHAARNNGASRPAESSRYLVFLDADDMLKMDFLSTIVEHLECHPTVGLAYSSYQLVDADGNVIDKDPTAFTRFVSAGAGVRKLRDDEPETPLESLVSRHEAIPSTAVLRRSVYEQTAGWRRFGVIEDKDMVMQMALLAPVHYVPGQLSCYRQHDANRSSNTFFTSMDELHSRWWNDPDLNGDDRDAVRRAITFDKRLAARFEGRHAVEALLDRRPIDAMVSGGRTLKRAVESCALSLRRRSARLRRPAGRVQRGE